MPGYFIVILIKNLAKILLTLLLIWFSFFLTIILVFVAKIPALDFFFLVYFNITFYFLFLKFSQRILHNQVMS